MKLQTWADNHNQVVTFENDCAILPDITYRQRVLLWHLEDYMVSSVTAGNIYLIPRKMRKYE